MKSIKRYLLTTIGCALIAFSLAFIIIPNNLASFGFSGLANVIYYLNGVNVGINLLMINIIFILLSYYFLDKEIIKSYIYPSLVIPILLIIMNCFSEKFVIEFPEVVLLIVTGGFVNGIGYSLIYKQGMSAGVVFLVEELIGKLTHFYSKVYSWFIDVIILVLLFMEFDYQIALYSMFVIIISKILITKARFGINDAKMFYIITSKEKEIKDFIIHDLKYEITELDVKGGFSKRKKKIFLTVIKSSDYYKLKEGLKVIDDKVFIAITDTYDVISRRSLSEKD